MLYNVKAGVIGLEQLGKKMAVLVNDHVKNLNLIAACGRTQKELLYAKNDLSLEYVYSDEAALFENHDVDALFIFSDPRYRAHQAIQAIDKGKHVFLMNPMALNVDDATEVFRTAASHPSQTIMCASPVRSNHQLQKAIEIGNNHNLGALEWISADEGFINSIRKEATQSSGSLYLDRLLDEIEMCLMLDERKVEKVHVRRYAGHRVAEAIIGDLTVWRLILSKEGTVSSGKLTIQYAEGRVEASSTNADLLRVVDGEGNRFSVSSRKEFAFSFPAYEQIHHFTQCILGKEKNGLPVSASLDSMRLALAFEKSDVLGEPVELDWPAK